MVSAEDKPIEEQLVDSLTKVFGVHSSFRVYHAKSIVVVGSFNSSAEAAGLIQALLFNGSSIPAIALFSDATGIPTIPDCSIDSYSHCISI